MPVIPITDNRSINRMQVKHLHMYICISTVSPFIDCSFGSCYTSQINQQAMSTSDNVFVILGQKFVEKRDDYSRDTAKIGICTPLNRIFASGLSQKQ